VRDAALREGLLRLRNAALEGGGNEDDMLLLDLLEALADRVIGPPGRAAFQAQDDTHELEVREGEWGLLHPLSCRRDLLGCPVHDAAAAQMRDDPLLEGRYQVDTDEDGSLRVVADIPS
jgi:hypothetical protein